MTPEELGAALAAAFASTRGERDAVVRAAIDLDDSGQYESDQGHAPTAAEIVEHLHDAPGGRLAERWNWWMGALETAYGGYRRFAVRRWSD